MHTVASMQNHSVVYHVDALISGAIEKAASDIHLEPTAHHLRIRFRVDGLLYDQPPITSSIMQQVVSRLKVLAQMDIAEKRIPQDGKFTLSFEDKPVDFRVSTFPSLFGEKMVVRILDRAAHAMSLDQLGFASAMLELINEISQKQSGFFLVTGPTGSGKTTTLYAILSALFFIAPLFAKYTFQCLFEFIKRIFCFFDQLRLLIGRLRYQPQIRTTAQDKGHR